MRGIVLILTGYGISYIPVIILGYIVGGFIAIIAFIYTVIFLAIWIVLGGGFKSAIKGANIFIQVRIAVLLGAKFS